MTPPPSITCPRCGRVSYHPTDIRQRYCGHCHEFHDQMEFAWVPIEFATPPKLIIPEGTKIRVREMEETKD
jgi:hypothetical protein